LCCAFNEDDDPAKEIEDYDMDMGTDTQPVVAAVTQALKAATLEEKCSPSDPSPGPDLKISTRFVMDEEYMHEFQSDDVP